MFKCMYLLVNTVFLLLLNDVEADIGTISGYPQVDVRDLNALTLSWNQVDIILGHNLFVNRLILKHYLNLLILWD